MTINRFEKATGKRNSEKNQKRIALVDAVFLLYKYTKINKNCREFRTYNVPKTKVIDNFYGNLLKRVKNGTK